MLRMLAVMLAGIAAAFAGAEGAAAASTISRTSRCWAEGNTFGIVECFSKAASQADRDLNSLYQKITRVLDSDNLRQLQDAERRWIAYRDATCKAEKSLWAGGTGGNPAYVACVDDETRHRLDYLQTTYRLRLQKLEH